MAPRAGRDWPLGVPAGEGSWAQQGRRHPPALPHPQYGDLGAEGADLWLAASSDQRVSIWVSDWSRGHCELLDWLSSPSPALAEVRSGWRRWQGQRLPTSPQHAAPPRPSFPAIHRPLLLPSAPGMRHCWCVRASACIQRWPSTASARSRHVYRLPPCGARGLRDPGLGRGGSHSLPTGGGEDLASFLCRVPEPVPRSPPHGHWLCW